MLTKEIRLSNDTDKAEVLNLIDWIRKEYESGNSIEVYFDTTNGVEVVMNKKGGE